MAGSVFIGVEIGSRDTSLGLGNQILPPCETASEMSLDWPQVTLYRFRHSRLVIDWRYMPVGIQKGDEERARGEVPRPERAGLRGIASRHLRRAPSDERWNRHGHDGDRNPDMFKLRMTFRTEQLVGLVERETLLAFATGNRGERESQFELLDKSSDNARFPPSSLPFTKEPLEPHRGGIPGAMLSIVAIRAENLEVMKAVVEAVSVLVMDD